MLPRTARLLGLLALLGLAAPAAHALPLGGSTAAAGLGLIEVFDGAGQVVCRDNSPISLVLGWGAAPGTASGFYQSTSFCASFAYPIDVAADCVGGPGAFVRCDELGPPRWLTLDRHGWFWYERDNLGFHFEVWGLLVRDDMAP